MLVKAKDGVKVPMEGHPRRYISENPVEVAATAYYRRRMREGDLVLVQDAETVNEVKEE